MFKDNRASSDPLRRRLRRLSRSERIEEAKEFVRTFHREQGLPAEEAVAREKDVVRQLKHQGFYRHTPDELAFGARIAWRNHANCVGRLFWKSLEVIDCREITDPDLLAGQVFEHMRFALGNGSVRSVISIFAPIEQEDLPPYIENAQIGQYAGYLLPGARILGDPLNVEFTRIATSLGWQPPHSPGRFDLLPLIIRDAKGNRRLYELPEGLIREVEITHPDYPGIAELGLKWYAVPCVSDMILTIGGIDYPCAPFNGYYMATEIASRNFVDPFRYDLLETIGSAIGATVKDPLWKDRVLLELNRAVLTSFETAQVTVVDHHLASAQFVDFAQKEHAVGRIPSANWSWVVPPQASAACPTYHMPMRDLAAVPNFYRSRATDGGELRVSRETEQRSLSRQRWDRAVRRWRNWHRRHT